VEIVVASSLLRVTIACRSPPPYPALPEQHPFNEDEVLATGSTAPSSWPATPSSRSSSGAPSPLSVSATACTSHLRPPGLGSVRSSSSACQRSDPPPTLRRSHPHQSTSSTLIKLIPVTAKVTCGSRCRL
jgi:hypothetical protein